MCSNGVSRLPDEKPPQENVQQPVSQFGVAYVSFLEDLSKRISEARTRASFAVNQHLSVLYWDIGRRIIEEQAQQGWGAQVIEQLSHDLSKVFPETRSFSVRNLRSMRAFAEAHPDSAIVKQLVSQITWYHNITLVEKAKDRYERTWYIQQTVVHGWLRAVLVHQVESNLHEPYGDMDEPQRKQRRHLRAHAWQLGGQQNVNV